jgi:hypothetical protein
MLRPFVPLSLIMLLLAASQVAAWHWDVEVENRRHGAMAGDPRVIADAQECWKTLPENSTAACIVLYAHVIDVERPVPANTQRPSDCWPETSLGAGGALREPRIILHSTLGFVEYSDAAAGETCAQTPRVHPESGLLDTVRLARDIPIRAHWFLSADALPGDEAAVGAQPCVTVQMVLQTGRSVGEGEVIAEGSVTKTILSTPPGVGDVPLGVQDPCPGATGTIDGETVTEFVIDLGPARADIPRDTGFLVHVEWHQAESTQQDQPAAMQPDWKVRTGSEHLNRIILPVEQAITVRALSLERHADRHYVHAALASPLGAYDIDTANLRLELLDAQDDPIPIRHLEPPILRYSLTVDGDPRPLNVTWPWQSDREALPPGTYTLRLSAANWQHSAVATGSVEYLREGAERERGAPAPPILLFVLIPLLALGAGRPRASCTRPAVQAETS